MANSRRFLEAKLGAVRALAEMEPPAGAPPKNSESRAIAARLAGAREALLNADPERSGSAAHIVKNGLNGGELSPDLGARFDERRTLMGCHELLNMAPLPWGGACRRPPMRFITRLHAAGSRLIPFIFSRGQARLLVFTPNGAKSDLAVYDPAGALVYEKAGFLPFAGEALSEFTYCQSADVIFTAHRSFYPLSIERHADNDWRLVKTRVAPEAGPPKWKDARYTGWRGDDKRYCALAYVMTALMDTGEESVMSAEHVFTGQPPLSDSWHTYFEAWIPEGAEEIRFYKKSAGVFGYIGSALAEDAKEADGGRYVSFEDNNIEPDTSDTPPRLKDPFKEADERPAVVFLHQQRLGYASSKKRPMTVWMSQTGNYYSMAASVPPADDDAIEATLAAPEANSILWALSDRNGLLLGTQAGEWLMAPSEGAALTPSDLSFQPQCAHGSEEGVAPVRAGGGILFAQRGGRAVRDLGYSFQDDKYNGSDASILARHIFHGRKIRAWAWQAEPWGVLWIALSDGTMAGLTLLKEYEIMAWHRHQTGGRVTDLAAIPAADGSDALFLLVTRQINGAAWHCLERFDSEENPGPDFEYHDGPEKQGFVSVCSPCLPEAGSQGASSFLLLKKINFIKARLLGSRQFKCRVASQGRAPGAWIDVPPHDPGFTAEAIRTCPIGAGWREGARLEICSKGPGPLHLSGLLISYECADDAGGQGL